MADEPIAEHLDEQPEEEGGPIKSFLEHLEDLRWVLIKSGVAAGVAMLACLLAGNYVVKVLEWPLKRAPVRHASGTQRVRVLFGTNQLSVDCTITCARPLKSERFGSLSLSWQLGSPLPTPISAPSPETLKPMKLPAVGTGRPSLSSASTFRIATSSPSASISVRAAVSRMATAGPVVSRFSVNTILPSFDPRASIKPGSYFTFHSTCPRRGTLWLPRLLPLTKSSRSEEH